MWITFLLSKEGLGLSHACLYRPCGVRSAGPYSRPPALQLTPLPTFHVNSAMSAV